MDEKLKKEILDCSMEIQRNMFMQVDSKVAFTNLKKRYSEEVIDAGLNLLKKAREHEESPYQGMTETITRCMSKLGEQYNTDFENEEQFFELCENAYKVFMNDKDGRGMPIVFLYSKGVTQLGVAPITGDGSSSPMDHLKTIVYQASPDAYCFCAEGSMVVKKDGEEPPKFKKYGDIMKNKDAEDIMFVQGNNKVGTKQFMKSWRISGKDGSLVFKEIKDMKKSKIQSEKLP